MLGESQVSIKSLVAVLSSFILSGKDKTASVQQRVSALHAASVYMLLLGIPGEETLKKSEYNTKNLSILPAIYSFIHQFNCNYSIPTLSCIKGH